MVTASYIIIGDEILSGRVADANLNFLAKELTNMGIILKEVRVVPDDENEIINTLNDLRKKYDYVFTSGGVGPTHDDITTLSVAKALKQDLYINNLALRLLENYYGKDNLNEPRLKMARIPVGSDVIDNDIMAVGGFYTDNIFVMAGVPKIFRSMFFAVKDKLKVGKKMESLEINLNAKESLIAESFSNLQKKYLNVAMGSYPNDSGTSLVFRSDDYEKLEKSFLEMKEILEKNDDNVIISCSNIKK